MSEFTEITEETIKNIKETLPPYNPGLDPVLKSSDEQVERLDAMQDELKNIRKILKLKSVGKWHGLISRLFSMYVDLQFFALHLYVEYLRS